MRKNYGLLLLGFFSSCCKSKCIGSSVPKCQRDHNKFHVRLLKQYEWKQLEDGKRLQKWLNSHCQKWQAASNGWHKVSWILRVLRTADSHTYSNVNPPRNPTLSPLRACSVTHITLLLGCLCFCLFVADAMVTLKAAIQR